MQTDFAQTGITVNIIVITHLHGSDFFSTSQKNIKQVNTTPNYNSSKITLSNQTFKYED